MIFSKKLIDSKKYTNELVLAMKIVIENEANGLNKKLVTTLNYLGNHKNDLKDKDGVELFNMIYPIIESYNTVNNSQTEKDEVIKSLSSLLISSKVKKPTIIDIANLSDKKYQEAVNLYDNDSTLVKNDSIKVIDAVKLINEICSDSINQINNKTNSEELILL